MDLELNEDLLKRKGPRRLDFNYWLLAISFNLFTFVVALNPGLIRSSNLLAIQLTISIPLLCSSIFAMGKIDKGMAVRIWETYSFLTFITAYGFMVNAIGIFLAKLIGVNISLYFWGANILAALLYSAMEIYIERQKVFSRLLKDFLFISLIIFLGILPALGLY